MCQKKAGLGNRVGSLPIFGGSESEVGEKIIQISDSRLLKKIIFLYKKLINQIKKLKIFAICYQNNNNNNN